MRTRYLSAIAVLVALAPASRGDEDVTGTAPEEVTPIPDGGIAPRAPTRIQLRSANVAIGLEGSSHPESRWRVTYELANPGKAGDLKVGFRFGWYTEHKKFEVPPNPLLPRSGVTLNDSAEVRCDEITDVRWDDVPRRQAESSGKASAWCTFTIRVPAGASRWSFAAAGYAALTGFGSRNTAVVYPLLAEAAWPGRPEYVRVVLSADHSWRWPILPVSPARAIVQERRIEWMLKHPDAAGLRAVVATFDSFGEVANGAPIVVDGTGFTAAASSRLNPQGRQSYDPSNVVDGDARTAWCEGAPGFGVGEWIEVRTNLKEGAAKRCRLEGFHVVPGYANSDAAWRRNGRMTRFMIGSCADPADGFEAKVSPDGEPRLLYPSRAQALNPKRGNPLGSEVRCFRLTILDVAQGKDPDACVSEFMPLLTCAH